MRLELNGSISNDSVIQPSLGACSGGDGFAPQGQPRRGRDVHRVPVRTGGVRRVVPRLRPGAAAVRRAEDLRVRPPGAVGGGHDGAGLLAVDRQTAEAVVGVGLRHRADVRPRPGGRRVPPQPALAAVVGAALVAVGDVQIAVDGVQHALVRQVPRGLSGQPGPGRARVRRAVHGVVLVRHADVDRLRRGAGRPGGLVEGDPDDALVVGGVPARVGRILLVVADVGEARSPATR